MFYNESVGRYVTQDSYLSSACDFSRGLCIDASTAATSSSNNGGGVRYMGSLKTLGFSVIDFRRSFVPSDQHDAPIALDGPTQVGASHPAGGFDAPKTYSAGRPIIRKVSKIRIWGVPPVCLGSR